MGRVVEVYGPESSGKTTLTIHAIAECQKKGGIAAFIDAEQAVAKGLVNVAVSPEDLDSRTELLVEQILQKPQVALQLGKALFYRQLETDMSAAYVDATTTMACNMMDESALEGVQAFIDKRKPNWRDDQ